jgi:hypothetical protein
MEASKGRRKFGLISCVASKTDHAAPAADLYTSPLFAMARGYVEARCSVWFVLSAKYGLLAPDRIVEPYEQTLLKMKKPERQQWADQVTAALEKVLQKDDEIWVLAGARYREFLVPWLTARGHPVEIPLKSLAIGRQLQWLKQHQ